ncbi:MAG: heavy metal-associated domain-containing protein [Lachnospiraceae bacterium]|nr:heavy metal-associated domain-containing protein [Lachnospiraceae bacterium]
MANAIIILVILVIAVLAVRSYVKKLAHGCCGAGGDDEPVIKAADMNPAHYPYSATVGIEGMTCKNCRQRVENALNKLDGIWAEVSLKEKSAFIRSKTEIDMDELRVAVARAGYTMQPNEKVNY